MLSTGDFLAAKNTGRKVATTETKSDTPRISATLIILKFKSFIVTTSARELFSAEQTKSDMIVEIAKQMSAMINASA